MTTSHLACEGGGEAMSRTCNLVRKSTVDRPHPFGIDNNNHILFELHTVIKTEVEFVSAVSAVSAGGSVKFLPAV